MPLLVYNNFDLDCCKEGSKREIPYLKIGWHLLGGEEGSKLFHAVCPVDLVAFPMASHANRLDFP